MKRQKYMEFSFLQQAKLTELLRIDFEKFIKGETAAVVISVHLLIASLRKTN